LRGNICIREGNKRLIMGDDMANEEGKHRIVVRRNICIREGNKRLIISDDMTNREGHA